MIMVDKSSFSVPTFWQKNTVGNAQNKRHAVRWQRRTRPFWTSRGRLLHVVSRLRPENLSFNLSQRITRQVDAFQTNMVSTAKAAPAGAKSSKATKAAKPPKAAASAPTTAAKAGGAPAKVKKPPAAVPAAAKKTVKPRPAKSTQAKSAVIRGKVGKGKLRGKGQKKKIALKFVVDCMHPAEDSIFDVANFEKYLKDRIKVAGKTNNFGNHINIGRDKNKIVVNSGSLSHY